MRHRIGGRELPEVESGGRAPDGDVQGVVNDRHRGR